MLYDFGTRYISLEDFFVSTKVPLTHDLIRMSMNRCGCAPEWKVNFESVNVEELVGELFDICKSGVLGISNELIFAIFNWIHDD